MLSLLIALGLAAEPGHAAPKLSPGQTAEVRKFA